MPRVLERTWKRRPELLFPSSRLRASPLSPAETAARPGAATMCAFYPRQRTGDTTVMEAVPQRKKCAYGLLVYFLPALKPSAAKAARLSVARPRSMSLVEQPRQYGRGCRTKNQYVQGCMHLNKRHLIASAIVACTSGVAALLMPTITMFSQPLREYERWPKAVKK